MASKEHQHRSAVSPQAFHHALMRPAILQILRAQGYYAASPGVADTITELSCRYMEVLAQTAALLAQQNNDERPGLTVTDVRMAFEDCGVFGAQPGHTSDEWRGRMDDTAGVDEFVRWALSRKNAKIRKVANVGREENGGAIEGGEEAAQPDYLSALKRKHTRTDQDSKYAGTILGKGIDHGEVVVEGGPVTSIEDWQRMMSERQQRPAEDDDDDEPDADSRPPSSGLSSLDDGDVEMLDMDVS